VNGVGAAGRERVVEVQRARVLAAMVAEVAERGVGVVTVGDVVARAGISRRTFYELFADREACFLAAFEHGLRKMAKVVVPAFESGGRRWRNRVRAGLAALLGFLDEEPQLGALCVVSALSGGKEVLERRARTLKALQGVMDEGRVEAARGRKPGALVAEGIVGAVFSVIHTRLAAGGRESLSGLLDPLMGMIVLPYLGGAAVDREHARSASTSAGSRSAHRAKPNSCKGGPEVRLSDPLEGLSMRLTYRTLCVLAAIAQHPGASNREVASGAGIQDQGQISKLLARLESLGLVHNNGDPNTRGGPNAWALTDHGRRVEHALRPGPPQAT
jgi:AcrR family transcriptional regulator